MLSPKVHPQRYNNPGPGHRADNFHIITMVLHHWYRFIGPIAASTTVSWSVTRVAACCPGSQGKMVTVSSCPWHFWASGNAGKHPLRAQRVGACASTCRTFSTCFFQICQNQQADIWGREGVFFLFPKPSSGSSKPGRWILVVLRD